MKALAVVTGLLIVGMSVLVFVAVQDHIHGAA